MSQFDLAMRTNGIASEIYFEKVGLPEVIPDQPDKLLPEKPFWKLINLVAREEQIHDFGIRVAELTPWHKISSIAPLIQSSQNLEALLATFCEIASSQSNTSKFFLRSEDGQWFFGSATETLFSGDRQMELYRVTSMIQLVQLAAGSGWRPLQVDFQMSRFNAFPQHPLYTSARLRFGQPNSRILIPDLLLKLPVNLEVPFTEATATIMDINLDFEGTIRQLTELYAAAGTCSLDVIAEIAGMSVRSLQRRLKQLGLNFKQLANQARFNLAKLMLDSTDTSITEIAASLGYTDSAHFSRAFRNWAGVSPSQYRKNKPDH